MDVKKLTDEQLEALFQQVSVERAERQTRSKRQTVAYGLTNLKAHEDLAVELMAEWWDDDKEAAFVESLLNLANASMEDPAYDEVAQIIEHMGDASNARSELEGMNDEEDEYGETEQDMESNIGQALKLLKAYWAKYAKKTKAPRKR